MSDQLIGEAAAYTKIKRQISMFSEEYEPANPTIKLLQTFALKHTNTWMGNRSYVFALVCLIFEPFTNIKYPN
jgi:hypothetical protein